MGHAPQGSEMGGTKIKSYIRVDTIDTSGANASIKLDYYEDDKFVDSLEVQYTNASKRFHYVDVNYIGSNVLSWRISPVSGYEVYQAEVVDGVAIFNSVNAFSYDQWSYEEQVKKVYGRPNLNWEKNPAKIRLS